jgi:hydroxymethylpyrimidine/phosphomethylpyrimidine kinase
VQADIKTVTALGGYASAAITSLTVQNTRGVSAVHAVDPAIIAAQIAAVMDDIGADAIKLGMIGERSAGVAIADAIAFYASAIPLIVDPVLAATSGDGLAGDGVAALILERFAPLAAVITPNADEARTLTGLTIETAADLIAAGEALMQRGATAALVKGGHLAGDRVEDALVTHAGAEIFRNARVGGGAYHGTGCTLASAVATGLAQGMGLSAATRRAIDYVQGALLHAQGFGGGATPLDHAWMIRAQKD